jgi:hypothetical protein
MNTFVKILVFVVFVILIVVMIKNIFLKKDLNVSPRSRDLVSALREASRKKEIEFVLIEINQNFDLVATYHGIKIIFSTDADFEKKIISLQKVLKSTKMGENIKEIDLRFNKIVLRYK